MEQTECSDIYISLDQPRGKGICQEKNLLPVLLFSVECSEL